VTLYSFGSFLFPHLESKTMLSTFIDIPLFLPLTITDHEIQRDGCLRVIVTWHNLCYILYAVHRRSDLAKVFSNQPLKYSNVFIRICSRYGDVI